MYEPEPDASHWGLNFLDVDHIFASHYYGESKHHEVTICHEQYPQGSHYDTGYRDRHYETGVSDVDNDEYIAHILQEELTQLSIAEASESSLAAEENPHTYTVSHDWHCPIQNYYAGDEAGLVQQDDVEPSSSCSSPGDRLYDGDEYSYILEISDDFDIDGEVGKRLNQMYPIPHIPKINGDIPSVDEATSDHQRLLDRLQLYDLVEHKVEGDGNCQFRALSDQFYRTPEHHKFVRKQVVNQLKAHPDMYEGYVPMAYGDYLKRMSKGGEWGDHVTLQAAADSYGVKVLVLTSFKDTCYLEILPNIQKSKRVIYLSFWAEVHYNSIYPRGDLLPSEMKKKKKRGMFRNKLEF